MATPFVDRKYQQSDTVNDAYNRLITHQQNKPGEYQSVFGQQMNDALNAYNNRGKFKYDINADALYQQAAQRYMQQGQQAMMDTMGQAAMLTGGYGNSAAQIAGQQTYQGWLQGLNDRMPEFYNMALQQYQMEGDDLLRQYQLLAEQEGREYDRYNDMYNRYMTEEGRLQDVYNNERNFDYSQYTDSRNFDYNRYTDERDYEYKQERDRVADEQWMRNYEENIRQFNESQALQRELAAERAAAAAAAASYGGGGGSSADAYELYRQAINGGYGSEAAKAALAKAGYTQSDIDKAAKNYTKKVSDSLKNPKKTRSGTM